jgi:trehalose-phosphatase
VSGRSLEDLISRVGIEGIHYAGNHGAEIRGPLVERRDTLPEAVRAALDRLSTRLESDLRPLEGVRVERKGLSTTVHVRQASPADAERARATVRSALGTEAGALVLREGKAVYEIRPRGGSNKGDAVREILEAVARGRPCLAIMIGDDATDEDAFAALPGGITVRVGREEARSRAAYRLEDAGEVPTWLRWLLGELQRADGAEGRGSPS